MEIGSIYACIAGDHRYASTVSVQLNDDGSATVIRKESGAVGGMDGPGGAYDAGVYARVEIENPTGAKLVRAIKECFDDVIRTYGRPSKNFTWKVYGRTVAKGLSAAKANAALTEAAS